RRRLDAQSDDITLPGSQNLRDVGIGQATRPLHVTVLHLPAVDEQAVGRRHLTETEMDRRRQMPRNPEGEPIPADALVLRKALLLPGIAGADRAPPDIVVGARVPTG